MSGGQRNPNAWNHWYHIVGSTYGTWLPGDPRGFRTFHHHEHVEGDYRNPPPSGVYEVRHAESRQNLKWPAVILDAKQRRVVNEAMIEKLLEDGIEGIGLAVAGQHFHLLAWFPDLDAVTLVRHRKALLRDGRDPSPRYFVGRARRNASFALSKARLKSASPVWAVRPKCVPVRDRGHQVNVAKYIERHTREDASVWMIHCGFI